MNGNKKNAAPHMSKAGRSKIARAQRARWATYRREQKALAAQKPATSTALAIRKNGTNVRALHRPTSKAIRSVIASVTTDATLAADLTKIACRSYGNGFADGYERGRAATQPAAA